jgi:predicted small lipoprotein YifL
MSDSMSLAPGRAALAAVALSAALAGCGGGGNPLDNPPDVSNPPPPASGQRLSFAYFQKCINPIFNAPLPSTVNGVTTVNTCAASGCHATATGTGGAFRVVPTAQPVDLSDPANTPDAVRLTDMYKNFYSAQGEVVIGSPNDSRLLTKPRLLNVLHGGGLIFPNDQDPLIKLFEYWITHPTPQGQDEFSTAANSMFTPPDPVTGTCNTQ